MPSNSQHNNNDDAQNESQFANELIKPGNIASFSDGAMSDIQCSTLYSD